MLCVYFLVIFNTKIIKSTKNIITIITPIIVVIILTLIENLIKMTELGARGGNLGNARKKNFFIGGVSLLVCCLSIFNIIDVMLKNIQLNKCCYVVVNTNSLCVGVFQHPGRYNLNQSSFSEEKNCLYKLTNSFRQTPRCI